MAGSSQDEIAIVGMGCRVPGAENLDEYWRVLVGGEDHVREVADDRWDFSSHYSTDENAPGKTYANCAGLLKDLDKWDYQFHGTSQVEAETIDPQQRLVLDCSHMAMEDGGFTRKELNGTNTGVYIGSMGDDFRSTFLDKNDVKDPYTSTGLFRTITSSRLSYELNLLGPNMVIDTACSSSSVAIHLACQGLKTGDCNLAFAGGVNVLLDPKAFATLSKSKMLSPSGKCHAFSSNADGYVRGEGCGIVILQKLADAEREGRNIWGVIETGTNQDGRMARPLTAPSEKQQLELMKKVYKDRNYWKNAIQYIEAHGTGTVTGDKTEVHALGKHFKNTPTAKDQGIYLGSVKTNIGHLESAAGVCGLVKVCLMMKYETIVPSLLYSKDKANPELKLDSYNFIVPTVNVEWTADRNSTRCACVNSFGFGGSNAHIAVKQVCQKPKHKSNDAYCAGYLDLETAVEVIYHRSNELRKKYLVIVSSQSLKGLKKNVEVFCDELLKKPEFSLADICHTTLCARDHFSERVLIAASTKEDLKNTLDERVKHLISHKNRKKTVFVFCGVGTTWIGMCTEMLQIEPFRATVMKISNELMKYTELSIIDKLEQNDDLSDPLVAHLAIFTCQVGLTELWKRYGVHPEAVVGQSVGEVAAAYCAGYLDLETAVKVIYHRSNELRKVEGGGMVVVRNVAVERVERMCQEMTDVNIAVYLSPLSCTVAGDKSSLLEMSRRFSKEFQELPVKTKKLDVKCAYHSSFVHDAGKALVKTVGEIQTPVQRGEIKFCSSVYGKDIGKDTYLHTCYWEKNVTEPVQFYQAIEASADTSTDVCFLEIGPSPVLQAHLKDIFLDDDSKISIPSMQGGKEKDSMLLAVAKLYTESDVHIDWDKFYKDFFNDHGQFAPIPRYIFQNRKLPHVENPGKRMRVQNTEVAKHLYVSIERKEGEDHIKLSISPDKTPFIYDHFVKKKIVVPGVTYPDVGFELAERFLGLKTENVTLSLDFKTPVILKEDQSVTMDVKTKPQEILSKDIKFGVAFNGNTVCFGVVKQKTKEAPKVIQPLDLEVLKAGMPEKFDASEVYSRLTNAGFDYGKSFKAIVEGQRNEKGDSCLTRVRIPECIAQDMRQCHIHPCLLDSLLQSTVLLGQSNEPANEKELKSVTNQSFPIGMDCIELFETLKSLTSERTLYIFVVHTQHTELAALKKDHYDVKLADEDGNILAAMSNLVIYTKTSNVKACDDLKYRMTLSPLQEFSSLTSTSDDRSKQKILLIDGSDCFKHEIEKVIGSNNQDDVEIADSNTQNIIELVNHLHSHLIVFIPPGNNEINDMASDVLERSAKNCMLLQNVLQTFETANIIIVTVGVYQDMYNAGDHKTPSVYGSEVWGFLRNAEVEFVHPRAVIVDIDSISTETLTTLYRLMQRITCQQTIQQSEYCIKSSQIFGLRLKQCKKRERTPLLRSIHRSSKTRKLFLRSSKMRQVADPFFIAPETQSSIDMDNQNENELTLDVEIVYTHDDFIYPLTRSDDPSNSKVNRATGFQVIFLEVVGKTVEGKLSTKRSNEISNSSGHAIACCPRVGSNILQVPKDCSISLSEVPNYRPGLLFACAYLFTLIEEVPSEAHVYAYTPDNWTSHPRSALMPHLLTSLKQCTVFNQSSPTQITDSTVVLVLRPLQMADYGDLKRCTKLITPVQFLPEELTERLTTDGKVDLKLIETRGIFSMTNLQKLMPKVFKWLKNINGWYKNAEGVDESFDRWKNDMLGDNTVVVCEDNKNDFCSQVVSETKVPAHMLFNKESIYIVVGGLTGVGWWMVKILAKYGAGNIVTFGRRKCRQESQTKIDNLSSLYRCNIEHMTVDVTNFNSVQVAIAQLSSQPQQKNIRGIFHGAGVLDSVLVRDLTKERLKGVMSPKVEGAVNLHRLTEGLSLDYFVMTSSLGSLLGSPGQSNYGAANAFMDSLANWRRSQGLAAQSVNWGAIGVGMAAEEKAAKELDKRGHQLINEEEFESCFIQSLLTNEPTIGYAKIINEKMKVEFDNQKMKAVAAKMEFLWEEDFIVEKETDTSKNTGTLDRGSLASLEPKELRIRIEEILRSICEKIITDSVDEISMSESYVSLGADSMSSLNLSNVLKDATGHTISSKKFLDPTFTLQATVDMLCKEFETTSQTE